jgi:hypothetical protein
MDNDKEADSCTTRRLFFNAGHVFQPFWFRYYIQNNTKYNKFLLDYHKYFLPSIGLLFWLIFLVA